MLRRVQTKNITIVVHNRKAIYNHGLIYSFIHSTFKISGNLQSRYKNMTLIEFKTFQLGFQWLCIFVVIGYGVISVRDFIKNDDLCEVSFKRFHGDKDSIYPALTMCLNTPFVEQRFRKISSAINSSSYESYLAGMSKVDQHLMNAHYNVVVIQRHDFLHEAALKFKAERISRDGGGVPVDKITTRSWAWRNRVMKCFSFELPFKKDTLIDSLSIKFNNTIFPDEKRPIDGWGSKGLMIYHHYPGQFGRSFPTGKRFWNPRASSNSYRMRLYFKGIEVLRRRHKSFEECHDDIPYDQWITENITATIKCNPPYWVPDNQYPICRTQKTLRKAQTMFWSYFYGNLELNHPCTEIQKVDMDYEETDDDALDKNQTRIHVSYLSNTFKEIQQMKAYTIMMLFGNVGGFVGLLLGYALIQIPNLVHSTLNSFIGDGLKI